MRKLLTALIDTIFPPSDDARIVNTLSIENVRSLYRELHTRDWTACASFTDERIRSLIHEAKYGNNTKAQMYLAHLLATYIDTHTLTSTALWIPIPLSPARMRARGYNQVHEVLKQTHVLTPISLRPDILVRNRDTRPQVELGRDERLTNMKGAFTLNTSSAIANHDIILVDDVTTTGATFHAAQKALQEGDPRSITLLALAH